MGLDSAGDCPSMKQRKDMAEKNKKGNNRKTARDVPPFRIMDCAPVQIATGMKAWSLRELKDCIAQVHPGSLYHHFWGRLISPSFDEPEYTNDFAAWARHELHDKTTAEMLSMLQPRDFDSIETLRAEMIDILENRLDESETVHLAIASQPFFFVRSQLVIFNTGRVIERVVDIAAAVREMTAGSIFYHFIEATRRTPVRSDDFTAWIRANGTGFEPMCMDINAVDPYFSSLEEVRSMIIEIFEKHLSTGQKT